MRGYSLLQSATTQIDATKSNTHWTFKTTFTRSLHFGPQKLQTGKGMFSSINLF